jgi:DNA replication protein DnaC
MHGDSRGGQVWPIRALGEALKLPAVSAEWSALAQRAADTLASFADFLASLLEAEQAARTECIRQTLLKLATLPTVKTIESYDFSFATGAPQQQIQELASLSVMDCAEPVVLLGPSGVGKSKMRFITAADLMIELAAAKAQGQLKEHFNRAVLGPKLLIVEALGD